MRKFPFCFILLFSFVIDSFAQVSGSEMWNTYLKRESTEYAVFANNNIFAISDGALYSVSKKNNKEYRLWDRKDGLSEVSVDNMEYMKSNKTLLLYYKSGAIDLITDEGVDHINDIALSDIADKTIDRIYDFGRNVCFLSGNIGIVDMDLDKKVINGTYFPSQPISSIAYNAKNNLMAIIKYGELAIGDRNRNLQDPYNWKEKKNITSKVKNVASLSEMFVVLLEDGSLEYLNRDGEVTGDYPSSLKNGLPASLEKIIDCQFGFLAFSKDKVYVVKDDFSIISKDLEGNVWVSQDGAMMTQSLGRNGFKSYNLSDGSKTDHINIKFNSPSTNNFYFTRVQDSKLMAVNGGRYFDRFYQKGTVNVFDGKTWKNTDGDKLNEKIGSTFYDPIDMIIHKKDKAFYYVSTWGEGVIKLDENLDFVEHYNDKNSSLVSAVPGSPNYIRVSSLSIDEKNNLWMTMGSSPMPVASMSQDGKWVKYDVPKIKESNALGTMICLPGGIKYVLDFFLTNKGEGFTIFKTNGLEYNASSDYTQHFSTVQEHGGKTIDFSIINCMALDKKGSIWFGSDIGFFIIHQPTKLPNYGSLPIAFRPVGGEEPPYYRILDNIAIKSIAVDNLNNKWMGTENDGIYLLSENGTEVIKHYDMSNSPLVSNNISSLSFDEKNGIMYIGTPFGLNSITLSSNSIQDSNTSDIKVYPNPLEPENQDLITISGLDQGMSINILDASGNTVHNGVAISSVYEWIPRTMSGGRLPSGIYTIVISSKGDGIIKTIKAGIVR